MESRIAALVRNSNDLTAHATDVPSHRIVRPVATNCSEQALSRAAGQLMEITIVAPTGSGRSAVNRMPLLLTSEVRPVPAWIAHLGSRIL